MTRDRKLIFDLLDIYNATCDPFHKKTYGPGYLADRLVGIGARVPIVCEKCKHFNELELICEKHHVKRHPDDYCSDGKLRI